MSINVRASKERGHANYGWLDTSHSFSFSDYYDPRYMGFRSLRVINEDKVHPSEGFPAHPHKDMEILTYVISGTLEHKDSMGNKGLIKAGEVQKITAGSGITHSEFNASDKEIVHFLQIWMVPNQKGIKPSYQQRAIRDLDKVGLTLFASPKGGDDIIKLAQDVNIYRGYLPTSKDASVKIAANRGAWVQVIKGELTLNGQKLTSGDGASMEDVNELSFKAHQDSEFLVFDLN